jgi:hypothetical protein
VTAGAATLPGTETHSHGPALTDPPFTASKVQYLQENAGAWQADLSGLTGIVMEGQRLSIDLLFPRTMRTNGSAWSELFLQTAQSNNAEPSGDYPYSQYVVFGTGTRAYLIDPSGGVVNAAMTDWNGYSTSSPAATAAILETDHGWAGANIIGYPDADTRVAGIRFDLVLPNTGEALEVGRVAVEIAGVAEADPAAVTDTPPPATEDPQPDAPAPDAIDLSPATGPSFVFPNSGGASRVIGEEGPRVTGYGRVQITQGVTPSGLVIFSNRRPDGVVNESAAQIRPLLTAGRTYFEVSADETIKTELSVANPNEQDVAVVYELRDLDGNITRSDSFTLKGAGAGCGDATICNQLSAFVDQPPFSAQRDSQGTLTLSSTLPISVMAFRAFYNERESRDLLLTSQPVIDLSESTPAGKQAIPYFAVGRGMESQVLLVNATGRQLTGTIDLSRPTGTFNSAYGIAPIEYSIAPNSVQKITIPEDSPVDYGQVLISPNDETAPTASLILSRKVENITVAQTMIPATMGNTFRMYARFSTLDRIKTYLSVSNPTPQAGTYTFTLTDFDGKPLYTKTRSLSAWGNLTLSLDPGVSLYNESLNGVVRITTDLPIISVVGLRERATDRDGKLFTSITPVLENTASSAQELIFPQFVAGEGFSSEFVLYSGTAGAAARGTLILVGADGSPLNLEIQ